MQGDRGRIGARPGRTGEPRACRAGRRGVTWLGWLGWLASRRLTWGWRRRQRRRRRPPPTTSVNDSANDSTDDSAEHGRRHPEYGTSAARRPAGALIRLQIGRFGVRNRMHAPKPPLLGRSPRSSPGQVRRAKGYARRAEGGVCRAGFTKQGTEFAERPPQRPPGTSAERPPCASRCLRRRRGEAGAGRRFRPASSRPPPCRRPAPANP